MEATIQYRFGKFNIFGLLPVALVPNWEYWLNKLNGLSASVNLQRTSTIIFYRHLCRMPQNSCIYFKMRTYLKKALVLNLNCIASIPYLYLHSAAWFKKFTLNPLSHMNPLEDTNLWRRQKRIIDRKTKISPSFLIPYE